MYESAPLHFQWVLCCQTHCSPNRQSSSLFSFPLFRHSSPWDNCLVSLLFPCVMVIASFECEAGPSISCLRAHPPCFPRSGCTSVGSLDRQTDEPSLTVCRVVSSWSAHLIQEPTAFRGGLGSALCQQSLSCFCAFVRLQAAVFSRLGRIAEERMLGAHSLLPFPLTVELRQRSGDCCFWTLVFE